jgi:hypothetical protein
VVLLTFGLLSPKKGIEHVLNALPDILAEFQRLFTFYWALPIPTNYANMAKPTASALRF